MQPGSNRHHNMDPLVLHQFLPTLCTPVQHMRHHERLRQRLIIPPFEDRRRQTIRGPTNHATIKVAQRVLPRESHIMVHQMDEDTVQPQRMPNGSLLRTSDENPHVLRTQIPFPLGPAVNQMGLIPVHKPLILEHRCMLIVYSVGGTTLLDLSQFGRHFIHEKSTTIGTILHTRTQKGRGRSAMLPCRESASSATEFTMNTAIVCNNRTMHTKQHREMLLPTIEDQNLESSLRG